MTTLACAAGIVLAVMHHRRAPHATRWMIVALGVMLAFNAVEFLVETVIYGIFAARRGGGGIVSHLLGIWYWFRELGRAAALAGLCYAVFLDRGFNPLERPPTQPTTDA